MSTRCWEKAPHRVAWRWPRPLDSPAGGPRGGGDPAAERWAQSQRRAGPGGDAQRRGGHWQIPPGARAHRAGGGEDTPRLTLRCSPYHTNSALYPVIEHLQRLLHWHRDATPAARLATLEQALQTAGLPLAEVVPLLAALLSLPMPAHYPRSPSSAAPEAEDAGSAGGLAAGRSGTAAGAGIWEDLHWADPSTLELLDCSWTMSPRPACSWC